MDQVVVSTLERNNQVVEEGQFSPYSYISNTLTSNFFFMSYCYIPILLIHVSPAEACQGLTQY